jgi:hypothetical protein
MRKSRCVTSILLALFLPSFLAVLTASASLRGPHELQPDAVRSGGPVGGLFQISFKSMDTKNPAVAYHAERKEYLVVWENDRPNNDEIQAQRVSASGTLVGNPFFVSAGPGGNRFYPDVVYNSQRQEYLVVWAQAPPGTFELHAQAVSAQGGVTGPDVTFATGFNALGCLEVAYSPVSDKYLAVWDQGQPDKVLGQVFNSNGSISGTNFVIAEPPGRLRCANVAFNRSRNEYLVVWSQVPITSNSHDVHARRVQGNGTPMYPESLALTALPNHQWTAAVAAMPTEPDEGQYLVGFQDYEPNVKWNLWALRLAGEGQVLGGHFPAFESPEQDSDMAIAADEHTHHYLLVSERRFAGIWGQPSVILGREVSLEGHLVGDEAWIAEEQATTPDVAAGPAGEFLVVFANKPGTSTFDIYGHLWGPHRVFMPMILR